MTTAATEVEELSRPSRPLLRGFLRALLVLCTLTWWVLPGMGVIDLGVTWDPDWPVMLEAGWGLLFTVGLGLPFLVAAVRPRLARAALLQLYVVTASLLLGAIAGLEPQSWWIFVGLALEIPLVHAVARQVTPRAPAVLAARSLPLLVLAGIATPVALIYAWEMARLNRLSLLTSDITNAVDHYSVQAAIAIALVALPAVAALPMRPHATRSVAAPGARRLLGTSTALMAAYLAVVSYGWPGADGGFSAAWSVIVLVWALCVLAAAWWPSRRSLADRASNRSESSTT
jgi:hypothetical protein